ncbi:MAG: hypothetical protein J1E85_05835 [Ruminococcus sp.]|nr:hypothetical protein [Ruminococcus sp.]
MKKIIIFCLAIVITVCTMFSAYATEDIDFKLNNVECNTNRLFDIEVVANSSQGLSAVTFEFTYDKSMFEFRGTKSSDTEASVKSNELDNCVKAVYLCTDGINTSGGKTIFTVTFKAIKAGTGYIDFNVYECVDQNIEFMHIGSCTSAKINVKDSSDNVKSTDNKTSNSSKSTEKSEKSNSSKSKSTRIETTTSQATIDNLGIVNPINDNKMKYMFIGISIGGLIVTALIVAFFLGQKTVKNKARLQK